MFRQILISILPYLGGILLSVFTLRLILAFSGARLKLAELRNLHRDQEGGVQSLSFVLTLPIFIMILMFIVQLSQITIAKVVVEYAAFSAVRSAIVWIPANEMTDEEWANQIGSQRSMIDQYEEDGTIYYRYEIGPGTSKFAKVHMAAAMACMPICPSADVGQEGLHPNNAARDTMLRAYRDFAPTSETNTQVPERIANKLSYALENTFVEIEIHHKDKVGLPTEAPLERWDIQPYVDEFAYNEIGWQDQVFVTVTHDFALLPGPGRLLARPAQARPGQYSDSSEYELDTLTTKIDQKGDNYVYPISARMRLQNEGQKSVLPYFQRMMGGPTYSYQDVQSMTQQSPQLDPQTTPGGQ